MQSNTVFISILSISLIFFNIGNSLVLAENTHEEVRIAMTGMFDTMTMINTGKVKVFRKTINDNTIVTLSLQMMNVSLFLISAKDVNGLM